MHVIIACYEMVASSEHKNIVSFLMNLIGRHEHVFFPPRLIILVDMNTFFFLFLFPQGHRSTGRYISHS